MKPPDILERLEHLRLDDIAAVDAVLDEVAAEIMRLCEDVATWRDRYEAERQDHEATIKAWDEERSGL